MKYDFGSKIKFIKKNKINMKKWCISCFFCDLLKKSIQVLSDRLNAALDTGWVSESEWEWERVEERQLHMGFAVIDYCGNGKTIGKTDWQSLKKIRVAYRAMSQ